MRAICDNCQNEFYWYGGQGLRLADVKSPCCRASAHGKKVNRKPARTADLPKLRCYVEKKYLMAQAFHSPEKATVYLWPDGCVSFSWPTGQGKFEVQGLEEGYRIFVCNDKGYVSYRRITEADYQKLLERGRHV